LKRPLRSPSAIASHIVRVDPAFADVVRAAGPFAPRPPSEDAFSALARAIAYQQLAGRAAAAIHGRFLALYGTDPPTPAAVLATPIEGLRACGLSGAKAAALLDLAGAGNWSVRAYRRAAEVIPSTPASSAPPLSATSSRAWPSAGGTIFSYISGPAIRPEPMAHQAVS